MVKDKRNRNEPPTFETNKRKCVEKTPEEMQQHEDRDPTKSEVEEAMLCETHEQIEDCLKARRPFRIGPDIDWLYFSDPLLPIDNTVGYFLLSNALARNESVKDLGFCDRSIPDEAMQAVAVMLKHNRGITFFCIERCAVSVGFCRILGSALGNNRTLKTLFLIDAEIDSEGASQLAEGLKINDTIDELKLSRSGIGPEGVAAVAQALRVNSTLRTLVLDEVSIGPNGAAELADCLTVNHTLRSLSISKMHKPHIGIEGMVRLLAAMKGHPGLESFGMSEFEEEEENPSVREVLFGEKLPKHYEDLLCKNTTLKHLSLGNIRLTAGCIRSLSEGLKANQTLETLDLSDNHIDGDTFKILSVAIKENCSLDGIYFSNCGMGDDDVWWLCEALKDHPSIKYVHLEGNNIGNKGAEYLGNALGKHPRLAVLELDHNRIGDEGVFALINSMRINRIALVKAMHFKKIVSTKPTEPNSIAYVEPEYFNPILEVLSVCGNPISDVGVEAFRTWAKRSRVREKI